MTHYVVKRLGFRITRGWFALIVIVGALAAAAFWIGPFKPLPAQLQLMALGGDGRFHDVVGIPNRWADTLPSASEATARFPLILAVHNAGAVPSQPTRLSLNMPARFRLTNKHGEPLRLHMSMGNPLVRYDLPVNTGVIEPGRQPTMLSGLDTLFLEPIVPSIYCTTRADSVPEFVSAPEQDPNLLARVRIFYSFSGARVHQRQAGLLTVQVDPDLVRRDPAPTPPIYPTEVVQPEAPKPEMHGLHFVGSRSSWCGDPGQPVEIRDALYETADGGRFFVLYHGQKPQKYLFDLNRDSIIEEEMWDADADGKLESRRAAHLPIPAFLMPYREAVMDSSADTTAVEGFKFDTSAATPQWLQTFYDTAAGPTRFAPSSPQKAQQQTAAPSSMQPPTQPSAASQPLQVPANMPVDTAQLRLFNNSDAGPLRFYNAQHGIVAPAPKREPVVAPAPATEPKLLGVPVEQAPAQKPRARPAAPRPVNPAPRPDSARPDTTVTQNAQPDTLSPDTTVTQNAQPDTLGPDTTVMR